VLTIGLLLLVRYFWGRVAPLIVSTVAMTLVLALVWTAIKVEYRAILNQGMKTQTVQIGVDERIDVIADLLSALDLSVIGYASIHLASRISYTHFLAKTMEYVPEVRPHEYGALWGKALSHVLTPRLIFPDKPLLPSDSEITMAYTGLRLASDKEGTSISIGWVGDSYIDFGVFGAVGVAFLLGALYAVMARHLFARTSAGDVTVVIAVLVVALSPMMQFEMASIKLFPGFLWRWIVCFLVVVYAWPWVRGFFCRSPNRASSSRTGGASLS